MSVLRHSFQRLGTRQLLVLAGLLTGIPWIAVMLASMLAIDSYFVPEVRARTETVAHLIQSDIDRALALGIPLNKLVGVNPYLATVIGQNPTVKFILITDQAQKVHFGITVEGQRHLMHPIAGTPFIASVTSRYDQSVAAVSMPLSRNAAPGDAPGTGQGTLYVGADAGPPQSVYTELQIKLLVGLIAVFLCCYELLVFFGGKEVALPIRAADRLVDRIGAGNLRHTERVTTDGDTGHLLTVLNRVARVLSDRVMEFRIYIDEVRRATRAAGTAQRLDALSAAIDSAITVDPTGPKPFPEFDRTPAHRLVVFILTAATTSIVPLLYARLRDGAGIGIDIDPSHLVPLVAFVAGISLGGRLLRPLLTPAGHGLSLIIALVLLGFAITAVALPVHQVATMAAAQALLGAAASFLISLHLDGHILDPHGQQGSPRGAVASGAVLGFGIAEIAARFDIDTTLYWPSFLLFTLACLVALFTTRPADWQGSTLTTGPRRMSGWLLALAALAKPEGPGSEPRGWLSWSEATAGCFRWRLVLPALGLAAPVRALGVLVLAVDLPRRLAAKDMAVFGTGTDGLALILLACFVLLTVSASIAGALMARSAVLRQPFKLLGRLVLALGLLLTMIQPALSPAPLASAVLGFALVSAGLGLTFAGDRTLALEVGRHDPQFGARRAALFIDLVAGLAVAATMIGTLWLLPQQQIWLRLGLAGFTLAAWLIHAGLAAWRRAQPMPQESAP
ncbi:MAG TPA: hypothetical protein VL574_11330 [Stellaceae bacterium]|nr:hypothetical protein [Stellaceae bacterium]